ncbi:hypothetical protein SVAN01_11526 [Stagonosporopsis vannaccii]|nr:hypothetical protein SVAN01_11526 [Stagonosporopsis vannaccii]
MHRLCGPGAQQRDDGFATAGGAAAEQREQDCTRGEAAGQESGRGEGAFEAGENAE